MLERINLKLKKIITNIKNTNYKQYIKTNVLFLSTVLTLTINAFLLRAFTVKNIFEIKPIIGDLSVILILCAFAYLIKPKKQIVYFLSLSILLTAICVINSMYYTFYLSFASVSLIATSFQITDVGDALVQNVIQFKDFIFIWQPIFIILLHINLKKKNYYSYAGKFENGKVRWVGTLTVSGIIIALFITTLSAVEVGRLVKQWNREFLVAKFGIYIYQVNDVIRSVEPKINTIFGYDSAIKRVRTFYEQRDSTSTKNKYTNIFEGKNIIMIHAESIQQFTMNLKFNEKEVTPNLNKLAKEGLYFSNFYPQVTTGTSSDTEFTLASGLLPVSSGTVAIGYWDREYVTLQKLLNEKDYFTFSMHGNNGSFWNRINVHKKYGYDKFFHKIHYDIDEEIGLGLSDKSFFRQSVEKIKKINEKEDRFFGTLITLTNHTPFDEVDKYGEFPLSIKVEIENEEGELEEVQRDYMEGTTLGNYFKSVRYADEAIGEFINMLDEEKLLDDTVIVIYGDHDARLSKKDYIQLYNYDPYTDTILPKDDPDYKPVDFYSYELNRKVPFIIYSKEKKLSKKIDTVMGMYDVLPTLGNMLGVKSEYALGVDMLSVNENIVVFPNGNWITNKIYYNSQKEEYLPLKEEVINQTYIEKHVKTAESYIQVSNDFIMYDYLKHKQEIEKLKELIE